jgi:hypothetical protein
VTTGSTGAASIPFEPYCQAKWHCGKQNANRLIVAAKLFSVLGTNCSLKIRSSSSAARSKQTSTGPENEPTAGFRAVLEPFTGSLTRMRFRTLESRRWGTLIRAHLR